MKLYQNYYTTDSRQREASVLLELLYSLVSSTTCLNPYPKLLIPSMEFKNGILVNETELLRTGSMDLLVRFVYPSVLGYTKANIIFYMKKEESSSDEIAKPLNKQSTPLTFEDGTLIPKKDICEHLYNSIMKLLEKYDGFLVTRILIRAYFQDDLRIPLTIISQEERLEALSECYEPVSGEGEGEIDVNNLPVKTLRSTKRQYSDTITIPRKLKKTALKAFLVADTETIFRGNIHVPYALGVMMVIPGERLMLNRIDTYFSEDYSSLIFPTFEERSTQMLDSFIFRIASLTKQNREVKTVYFHNLGRFDGLFILKHLVLYHPNYKVKPLMRDNKLYEIAVYSDKNRLLFAFRDSLHLLPGSLDSLANNLCPELGSKGSISFNDVKLETLSTMKESLIDYMKQDILLLGGIMLKFQDLYYKSYQADIVKKLTTPSLALSLFREKYYDDQKYPIHIPNKNEDTFIRSGYYGGHTDAYIPKGRDLYYYDVNSLYPFIMKESPMPVGKPVWYSSLEDMELDSMFGFIEAYVECPKSLNKPFLPYRNKKDGTLLFPTGTFVGVYYSEELKYAREIGYTIIPINGYLFEKKEGLFKDYVNSLFESRSNAKKMGNNALSYVYKLLMNSLYGRFGISPQSTITEMCDLAKRNILIRSASFISEVNFRENLFMVSYLSNTEKDPTSWDAPRNSAVQLSAAITASARIYMYKYISREDCYYTDTDSIVLGNPLPEEDVSSSVLGKLKLEDQILMGYFLAPKCYCYSTEESEGTMKVIKFKGAGKSVITPEWFSEQYANPSRSLTETVTHSFRPNWKELEVERKDSPITLRTVQNTKRVFLFNKNQEWVGSDPLYINDLSSLNYIGIKVIQKYKMINSLLESENSALSQKISQLERDRAQRIGKEERKVPQIDEERKVPQIDKEGRIETLRKEIEVVKSTMTWENAAYLERDIDRIIKEIEEIKFTINNNKKKGQKPP